MSTSTVHSPSIFGQARHTNLPRGWTGAPRGTSIRRGSASWWTMLFCSAIAFSTSGYLAWSSMTSSPVAGCDSGTLLDCNHVLHSRWSHIQSVPVSIPAMLLHASLMGLLLWRPSNPSAATFRSASIGLAALAAAGAAIWFIGLQVFALGHLCPYCLVAHGCGLLLAVTYLWNSPLSPSQLTRAATGAAASVAVLIGMQLLNDKPVTYEVIEHSRGTASMGASGVDAPTGALDAPTGALDAPTGAFDAPTGGGSILFEAPDSSANHTAPTTMGRSIPFFDDVGWIVAGWMNPALHTHAEIAATTAATPTQRRKVRVLDGIELVANDWPMIGEPTCELVFVELFDYTCPHCQRTHAALEGARQHFGDRLGVLTLPVPLDGKCNPTVRTTHASHAEACDLAKLAVALWKVDRDQFEEFHEYLFTSQPRYADALRHARQLVEPSKLDEVMRSSLPGDYISKHVALYQHAGAGKIPKIMFPSATTVGAIEDPQSFIRLIETHLKNR